MSLNPKKTSDSKIVKFINFAGTSVMLNFLFLVCSLPLVTIGPALSGLFSGVRYMIRGDGAARGFFAGFRTHLVRMLVVGTVLVAMLSYLVVTFNSAYNTFLSEGVWGDMILHGIPLLLVTMVFTALAPLNIYIRYDTADWLTNGVNLILKAPHWVGLGAIMFLAPVALVLWWGDALVFLLSIAFVGFWFVLTGFVATLFLKDALVELLLAHKQEEPELYEESQTEN